MRKLITALGAPERLDQVRDSIRVRHYSIRAERTCLEWIKRVVLFHDLDDV